MALTADLRGGLEAVVDLLVHLYEVSALLHHLDVARLDLLLDPISEDVLEDRRADIADPLLRHLVDLLRVGEVVVDLLVAIVKEGGDVLDGEALVLRHGDPPNLLALDVYSNCG